MFQQNSRKVQIPQKHTYVQQSNTTTLTLYTSVSVSEAAEHGASLHTRRTEPTGAAGAADAEYGAAAGGRGGQRESAQIHERTTPEKQHRDRAAATTQPQANQTRESQLQALE